MKRRIVFITGNNRFFGQTRKPWTSMDADKIRQRLVENGFDVDMMTAHEVVNREKPIKDAIVFYAFSQRLNERSYIRDMVRHLDDGSNFIVPSYDLLQCHENKGYQELYKKRVGEEGLKATYFSGPRDLEGYSVPYPVVLKTLDQSNGKGVHLIRNQTELDRCLSRFETLPLVTRLDLFRRKRFRRKKSHPGYPEYNNRKDYEEYSVYIKKERGFILQEFVPDLDHDYRVLAFPDRCWVVLRHTPEGDFRASGAKLHDHDFEADPRMLNFAWSVYQKMDTAFLSMDICPKSDGYGLFEYQALHFGIRYYVHSRGYYERDESGRTWRFVPSDLRGIEVEIADGLTAYLRRHGF